MVAIAEVVARIGSDKSKAYLDVRLKLVCSTQPASLRGFANRKWHQRTI